MSEEVIWLTDHQGRQIRLTSERQAHIMEHAELAGQYERLQETITAPEMVVATHADANVWVYHRYYAQTPVTSKYLLVAVKVEGDDAFVLTAFFSSRIKKGDVIWTA